MTLSAGAIDSRARGWRHLLAAALLTGVCCLPAVSLARASMRGVSQPYDLDQFRDLASAQAAADGRWLSDPFYRTETIWYPPLLPWTIAVASRIRHSTVALTLVQAGPYLNAVAPIALFVMVTRLFGPWPACIAVVSLLYAPRHTDPPWATPAYSPWLFASNFGSGFFYLSVAACAQAVRQDAVRWWLVCGGALGVVFLAHAAPAIVLGLVMASSIVAPLPRGLRRRVPPVAVLVIVFGAAALVGAPLLWSIVARYHLHVVNHAPAGWVWGAIADPSSLLDRSLNVRTALAAAGTVVLIRRVHSSVEARLVLAWLSAAGFLFAYGFIRRAVGVTWLPAALVPDFHFYFYLRAAGCVLTAVAVWGIGTYVAAVAGRARDVGLGTAAALTTLTLAIALAVFTHVALPAYRDGVAFGEDNAEARAATFAEFDTRVVSRLREETPANAVVLASPATSLVTVGPSGRAVVAVPPEFSNPYVPFEPRAQDQQRLFALLMAGDRAGFLDAAAARGVTHVLLGPRELVGLDALGGFDGLEELSRKAGFAIFAVRRPADRNGR